jgi:hypothetical protein
MRRPIQFWLHVREDLMAASRADAHLLSEIVARLNTKKRTFKAFEIVDLEQTNGHVFMADTEVEDYMVDCKQTFKPFVFCISKN